MVTKSESNNNGGSMEPVGSCAPGSDHHNICVHNAKELNKDTKNISDTCKMCQNNCYDRTPESVQTLCGEVIGTYLEYKTCASSTSAYDVCVRNAKEFKGLKKNPKNFSDTCKTCYKKCEYETPQSVMELCKRVIDKYIDDKTCAPGSDSHDICVNNARELNKNSKYISDTCQKCKNNCPDKTSKLIQRWCGKEFSQKLIYYPDDKTCAPGSDSHDICVNNARELNKNSKYIFDTCQKCENNCYNITSKLIQTLCDDA